MKALKSRVAVWLLFNIHMRGRLLRPLLDWAWENA